MKGLILNIINDEACSLHGPRLLIKWAQLHLRPTQDAWIHGAAWNCVFVANCYCYEVQLLADPLRWWIVLMKCPGFSGNRLTECLSGGPSCSFVVSQSLQRVMQGGANNSDQNKVVETSEELWPSFPPLIFQCSPHKNLTGFKPVIRRNFECAKYLKIIYFISQ